MINVVCVKQGTLYGAEYVNILFDMVLRNLNNSHHFKFFCFTDNPEGLHEAIQIRDIPENLVGWWPKLYLFKDGLFPDGEQVIFIDLDTLIVSGLDDIFKYNGDFAIIRDFISKDGIGSAFMSWKAGKYGFIWDDYVEAGYPSIAGGDQAWIGRYTFKKDFWQDLFPEQFVSYKIHCIDGIPKGARVICFHGVPMPHQITGGWVPNIWREGGGSSLELAIEGNTHLDRLKDNIKFSLGEGINILDKPYAEHGAHAVIIGGGPSINNFVNDIKMRQEHGQHIVALNNSWKWLEKRGINVDMQVMVDARPENDSFVPDANNALLRLYATQCDHRVITLAKKANTLLWNSYLPELDEAFSDKNMFWIGSGTSVGLRSILLLYTMGYRHFHIYGYDSSYESEEGHAYEQKLNHGEKVLDVVVHGRTFKSAPWMITQSQEFLDLMAHMTGLGCQFTIHGDGLLQHMVKTCLVEKTIEGDLMKIGGMYWPSSDTHCHIVSNRLIGDLDEVITMVPVKGVAVQAGGNVGLWPKRLAEQFETVFTFEPDEQNYRCMELNCIEPNIIKHRAALGDKAGFVGLLRNETNTGAHKVDGSGDIPVMTIDSLNLPGCDLIYLDIEGYEIFALQGASLTIKNYQPVIVIEFNEVLVEKYGVLKEDIVNYLSGFGYELDRAIHRDLIFTVKREKKHGTC